MEVLTARIAPVFNGGDNWKYKRPYDNQMTRHSNVIVEQFSDRTISKFEDIPKQDASLRKSYSDGVDALVGCSIPPVSPSLGRLFPDGVVARGHVRNAESSYRPDRSRDSLSDDPETSQPDDSENSGHEVPAETPASETQQKWPIIQIVEPPNWLPECWTAVLRTRESGSKDKYYVDPVSQRRFRSKTEVNYFLQTGKSYRYKRNLALLTKPLKDDPVSLSNTKCMKNSPADLSKTLEAVPTSLFTNAPIILRDDRRGARSICEPDDRFGVTPFDSEAVRVRKSCSRKSPKPKVKVFSKESSRSVPSTESKRIVMEDENLVESFHSLGMEKRGKLILKLKRKAADSDEDEMNRRRQRPFEVIGAISLLQENSKTEGDVMHHLSVGLESTSKLPHLLVPLTHVSGRPSSKAPPWQIQAPSSCSNHTQHGGRSMLHISNGQGPCDTTSGCASVSIVQTTKIKLPQRKESPAEQLQRVGKKLCQQAVGVLSSAHGRSNPLQQISSGLHAAMSIDHVGHVFNPIVNAAIRSLSPHQHKSMKRMIGQFSSKNSVIPIRDDGHHISNLGSLA